MPSQVVTVAAISEESDPPSHASSEASDSAKDATDEKGLSRQPSPRKKGSTQSKISFFARPKAAAASPTNRSSSPAAASDDPTNKEKHDPPKPFRPFGAGRATTTNDAAAAESRFRSPSPSLPKEALEEAPTVIAVDDHEERPPPPPPSSAGGSGLKNATVSLQHHFEHSATPVATTTTSTTTTTAATGTSKYAHDSTWATPCADGDRPEALVPSPVPVPASADASSPERRAKRRDLLARYEARAEELARRAVRECVPGDFSSLPPLPPPPAAVAACDGGGVPPELVPHVAAAVQGSPSPLSALTADVTRRLSARGVSPTPDPSAVAARIKLLARRVAHLGPPPPAADGTIADAYEDTTPGALWRWELAAPPRAAGLPDAHAEAARKARAVRRRFSAHVKAARRLLTVLRDDSSSDALVAREEEKVLRFEREEERARLASEMRKEKEREKERATREREEERARKQKAREEEKERKKEEKRLKKEALAQAKELERKTKEEELLKEKKKKQAKVDKQKALLMSFFSSSRPKKRPSAASRARTSGEPTRRDGASADGIQRAAGADDDFDGGRFWDALRRGPDARSPVVDAPLFPSLSSSARRSRERKTRQVLVSYAVAATRTSSAFDARRAYDEVRTAWLPNKLKFLSFSEDHRPAYRGTWSKGSSVVTGRTPFGKDDRLDYDVDSEAEWEEDPEDGEDVDDDAADDDEDEVEGSAEYDYQDEFLMEDGQLDHDDDDGADRDNDNDDFAKELTRKRREEETANKKRRQSSAVNICFVSPAPGGRPPPSKHVKVEGMDLDEAVAFLDACEGVVVDKGRINLDRTDDAAWAAASTKDSSTPDKSSAAKMSNDDLKSFCEFVHNCELNSKEKVVEELVSKHPNLEPYRTQIVRKLNSIATKRKVESGNGALWVVKAEVLRELGLKEDTIKSTEMSDGEMKTFCQFVHGSEISSKEKLVDELRAKYPSLTSSRRVAMRKLVSIADKRRLGNTFTWLVKDDVLRGLGLEHLIKAHVEEPSPNKKSKSDNAADKAQTPAERSSKSEHSAKKRKTDAKTNEVVSPASKMFNYLKQTTPTKKTVGNSSTTPAKKEAQIADKMEDESKVVNHKRKSISVSETHGKGSPGKPVDLTMSQGSEETAPSRNAPSGAPPPSTKVDDNATSDERTNVAKKRKTTEDVEASANLLANFLVKKKN